MFDDIAVEVTMAILQFFSATKPEEKYLYRAMKALARFVTVSFVKPMNILKSIKYIFVLFLIHIGFT